MGGVEKGKNMESTAKLAKLLRTSERVVLNLEKKMEEISHKKGVIEKIVRENEHKVRERLVEFGFGLKKGFFNVKAEEIYNALIKKVKETDQVLFKHFHQPDLSTAVGYRSLINATKELTGHLAGFYLKEAKAKELLKLNPPQKIMESLGYGNDIDKMLDQEDIFEIFCALRFVEDSRWLNDVFFKPYQDFKKEDFEKREVKVVVLPEKWAGIGQKFLGAKLHHMSHLKELGIVFVIPITQQRPGEIIYLFFMTLHYTYETDWHAQLFKMYSQEKNFTKKMINALRVEVGKEPLPDKEKMSWRIVAKYLAKNNPDDPRLAEPHISPEAWHYTKVVLAIQKFARRFPNLGLNFWGDLDVIGEYFPSNSKKETLISFDLFDNGISLLRQAGFQSKYLYHQQEALWNKVFSEYMGEGAINKLMMENLDKGYVTL